MAKFPLKYNEPVTISPLVIRVLADNGSYMTGPGTNTYLIGKKEIAVIDPGTGNNQHLNAIVDAAEASGKIKWIFVTHNHPDHSPGARPLQARTGAELFGLNPPEGIYQDYSFKPDRLLKHDEKLRTSEFTLQAIHTPGHASNHLCFLLEDENLLFTGDHIMQGSTVVIIPPYGHMGDYLKSLENLKSYKVDNLAPGHGQIMENPLDVINWYISHRLEREAKVVAALKRAGGQATIERILAPVYDDVPSFMHGVAAFSLEAHLIKLEEERKVVSSSGTWKLVSA